MGEVMRQILIYSTSNLPRSALAGELRALNIADEVTEPETFDQAIQLIEAEKFSALIFDDPTIEQQLRLVQFRRNIPLFFLLTQPREVPEALVYQKPFRLPVLLTAIISATARFEQSDDAAYQIGLWRFNPAGKVMTFEDKEIKLTEKEAALLDYLSHLTATVDRETLLREIWGYGEGISTHTLETHIYRLRQKLDNTGISFSVTSNGGYKLLY